MVWPYGRWEFIIQFSKTYLKRLHIMQKEQQMLTQ